MNKLVLLACVSLPVSLFADGGLPDKPYIYVEGKAEIEKPADMVTLRFQLVARNADQAKANQEVQTKANKIFALPNEKKIADADVIASDIRSEPQFEKNDEVGSKRGKLIGYSVTRTFSVSVRDLKAFAGLVDQLLAFAGLEFSGIDTGLSKEKEVEEDIWDKALRNAREKAEKTVKATDMKIDSVFALSPVAFPQIRQKIFPYSPSAETESALAVEGLRQLPSQYRLAPITVSQSVHVIYLISPAK
jgi:uncharacterized protein YggE